MTGRKQALVPDFVCPVQIQGGRVRANIKMAQRRLFDFDVRGHPRTLDKFPRGKLTRKYTWKLRSANNPQHLTRKKPNRCENNAANHSDESSGTRRVSDNQKSHGHKRGGGARGPMRHDDGDIGGETAHGGCWDQK